MTETGVLGTFGGINIPPVTVFMDGFARGAAYYNEKNGTDVTVLGWDPEAKDGLFTNNFESLDDGRTFAQNLYDEGADIVMPVAGPVGLGSAALADELGTDKLKIIGVDARPVHDRHREAGRLPDVRSQAHGRHRPGGDRIRHGTAPSRAASRSARSKTMALASPRSTPLRTTSRPS